jgi:hypothetical protein
MTTPATLCLLPREEAPIDVITQNPSGICPVNQRAYHAVKSPTTVSASRLRYYHFSTFDGWYNDNQPAEETDAMALGSLVHCMVNTPELFNSLYKVDDFRQAVKKDGTPYAKRTQDPEQKRAWEASAAAGMTVIERDTFLQASSMARAAVLALNDIFPGRPYLAECAFWAPLELKGIPTPFRAQAMMDLVSEETDTVVDIKTTSSPVTSPSALFYTVRKYAYHVQAAFYDFLYYQIMRRPLKRFVFVFVSKSAPFISRCMIVQRRELDTFVPDLDAALDRLAAAHKLPENESPSPVIPPIFYGNDLATS